MDTKAYEAARQGLARRDMSHFGRYRVWGKDAANLLHHLTTQDINSMRPAKCARPLWSPLKRAFWIG